MFNMPGGMEWIVILVFGLLIFGRRLPEVGRSLGRGIIEFKKGIKGIDDEIETESSKPRQATSRPAELNEPQRRPGLESPAASSSGSAPVTSNAPVEALR